MIQFYVEFRFYGYPKRYLRSVIREIAQNFRVKGAIKERPVPHMTLYGPSTTNDIKKVFSAIENVGGQYSLIPLTICGFNWRHGPHGKVIAANITASRGLRNLRLDLARELSTISSPQPWDTEANFWFHSTVAFKDIDKKFNRIWRFVNARRKPSLEQYLTRITVLNKKRKIMREYDIVLQRWLKRWQVIPPIGNYWKRKTKRALTRLEGFHSKKRESFLERIIFFITGIKNIGSRKSIYLISDTHFDHVNIIKYCDRPYANVQEMNRALTENWNSVVKHEDTVYFLGDWSFGRRSRPPEYWIRKLNGRVVSISGSHDKVPGNIEWRSKKILNYGGIRFLLIHDPTGRTSTWDGWVIHGHHHNNNIEIYPFINGESGTINVSAELINYRPVSIDYLLSLNLDSIRKMRTVNSEPERW